MSPTFTPTARDNIGPLALLTVGATTERSRPPCTPLARQSGDRAHGTHLVATRRANPWGHTDTLCTMYEWYRNRPRANPPTPAIDPCGAHSDAPLIRAP